MVAKVLSPRAFQAVIFDLDGVITDTAALHEAAWKELFNSLLGKDDRPFSGEDYREFVDGKPRYDGIESFLASRGIDLPWGEPDDPPDRQTICGLGNHKNAVFLELLRSEGPQLFPSSVELVRDLRSVGVKTGVVSSSKNCVEVLQAAGITELFDVKLDGKDRERLGLKGKPHPDTFVEAARTLGVATSEAVVVEDAVSGVEAGKAGEFGLVIGVNRVGQSQELKRAGADWVVSDLAEIAVSKPTAWELLPKLESRGLALFLDYDGTLAPIVARPELAQLSDPMRTTLKALAKRHLVTIVSGRDRKDVQSVVGLPDLIYAGSHGFDVSGPNGLQFEYEPAQALLPALGEMVKALKEPVTSIPGAWVEAKRFAIAVHYRQVNDRDVPTLDRIVEGVVRGHHGFVRAGGKRIFEIKPDLPWNKGQAVLWLVRHLQVQQSAILYIGDDVTDEDAFQAVRDMGIGICVQETPRQTRATYTLSDVADVERFLGQL